MVRRRYYYIIK